MNRTLLVCLCLSASFFVLSNARAQTGKKQEIQERHQENRISPYALPGAPIEEPPRESFMPDDVAEMPVFGDSDGQNSGFAFRQWVMGRITYPLKAAENGIQGRVTVTFTVETDGSLGRIEVLSSPDEILSEEVLRVLRTAPRWQPGRKDDGTAVPVQMTLPLDFRLS